MVMVTANVLHISVDQYIYLSKGEQRLLIVGCKHCMTLCTASVAVQSVCCELHGKHTHMHEHAQEGMSAKQRRVWMTSHAEGVH